MHDIWHNTILWWKDSPVTFVITCIAIVVVGGFFAYSWHWFWNEMVDDLTEAILAEVAPWRRWR